MKTPSPKNSGRKIKPRGCIQANTVSKHARKKVIKSYLTLKCVYFAPSKVCGNNTGSGVRPRSILIDSNTTSEPQLQQPVCQNTSREALRTQSEDTKMSNIRGQRRAPMKKRVTLRYVFYFFIYLFIYFFFDIFNRFLK